MFKRFEPVTLIFWRTGAWNVEDDFTRISWNILIFSSAISSVNFNVDVVFRTSGSGKIWRSAIILPSKLNQVCSIFEYSFVHAKSVHLLLCI